METKTATDKPAESSPALEVPKDPGQYAEWRQTGKLPKADSTPAKETPASTEKSAKEKTAPASEPGTSQEHKEKPSTAATRLEELLADLKTAGLTPAELKTYKRQAQQESKEQPKATTEQTEKPAELKPPVKPDPNSFKTYEELEAARDKYAEDLAAYHSKKAVEDFKTEQRQSEAAKSMTQKLDDARKRYPDLDTSIYPARAAIFDDANIPTPIKAVIDQSPVFVDVLYTLGSKPEDLAAFVSLCKSDPVAALRKAVLIEHLVQEELAKGKTAAGTEATSGTETARGEDGKFQKAAPEKQATKAPPPAKEVSGRGSTPPDEVETAVKANDFKAYQSAQNRKALAKHQGR